MSLLPVKRLGYRHLPFSKCGVDCLGPLYVSIRRSIEKRFVFQFTCMTISSVHIETGPSMITGSCVTGVARFLVRRSTPSVVWSDNGTDSVGAEK